MPRASELQRKLYFFRLANANEMLPDLLHDVEAIEAMPANNNGKYLVDRVEGDRLILWASSKGLPIRIRFGRTRLAGLPSLEKKGELEPLELEAGQGLNEACHLIIFPDGIVVAEFNFDGPRISRLGDYLYSKRTHLKDRPKFLPLFQRDVLKMVQAMRSVNLIELKGKPDARALLSEADQSLGKTLKACQDLGATKAIGLSLAANSVNGGKLKSLGEQLARLFQSKTGEMRDVLDKVRLRGIMPSGKSEWVDVLEDQLIVVRTVQRLKDNSKAVSSPSAFSSCESAYNDMRDLLHDAVEGHIQ